MSFEEIKAAVLALPEAERIELLHALDTSVIDDDELSAEQKADLLDRIREHEADPEGGEDAFVVIERLQKELADRRLTKATGR